MQIERRFFEADKVELRLAGEDDEPKKIVGYFARYNELSPTYGKFRERIAPGFFDEALGRDDIRALFNHDESRLLGRNKSGTLRLRSDDAGLFGEIDPIPETPTGSEVRENVRLGNLSGASFAFSLAPDGDKWAKAADGVWERTLIRAGQVYDVSVVTNPFYPTTNMGLRQEVRSQLQTAFDEWAAAHPSEVVELLDRRELDECRLRLAGL